MAQRQLLWYRESSNEPETHIYNILIINEPRKIARAIQALHEHITETGTVIEDKVIDQRLIKNSGGLHYSLRSIETNTKRVDFSQVYKGRTRHDRRLQSRANEAGWEVLLRQAQEGNI